MTRHHLPSGRRRMKDAKGVQVLGCRRGCGPDQLSSISVKVGLAETNWKSENQALFGKRIW